LKSAADLLRRKADEYRALGEEHAANKAELVPYKLVEIALREVASALEVEERDREAA
jgi:hypothetical protein